MIFSHVTEFEFEKFEFDELFEFEFDESESKKYSSNSSNFR